MGVEDDTTYGLNPESLARLFEMGLEGMPPDGNPSGGPTPAEALRNILTNPLSLDPATPDSLPTVLNWPFDKVIAAAGGTVIDLLLDSGTDLAVIKVLKDYGKELARQGGPKGKQAAATIVYYAAIASALVFHQQKITKHRLDRLHEAYTALAGKPWIPSELRNLFRKASDVCLRQKPKPE
jgi:hypothetical protein